MPRGLSDSGHLRFLFHPPSPSDCLASLKLKKERLLTSLERGVHGHMALAVCRAGGGRSAASDDRAETRREALG